MMSSFKYLFYIATELQLLLLKHLHSNNYGASLVIQASVVQTPGLPT